MNVYIITTSNCPSSLAEGVTSLLINQDNICFTYLKIDSLSVHEGSPHEAFFSVAKTIREKKNISNSDFVVLLTATRNELNWFSAFDDENNIYVNTLDWNYFVTVEEKYPIAFSIAENILQKLMKLSIDNLDERFIHIERSKGCINDFCGNKADIILKFQSANLCPTCLKRLKEEATSPQVVRSMLSIINSIRAAFVVNLDEFENNESDIQPKLYIKSDGWFLNDVEITLPPACKALYLLLLVYPKGIKRHQITGEKIEMLNVFYNSITGSMEENNQVINTILYTKNAFAQYRSKMNNYFKNRFPKSKSQQLLIGSENNRNMILFDRTNVIIDSERLNGNLLNYKVNI